MIYIVQFIRENEPCIGVNGGAQNWVTNYQVGHEILISIWTPIFQLKKIRKTALDLLYIFAKTKDWGRDRYF